MTSSVKKAVSVGSKKAQINVEENIGPSIMESTKYATADNDDNIVTTDNIKDYAVKKQLEYLYDIAELPTTYNHLPL